jgi:L,D-peptidoglycan transpeptidase YkuD (ErfK/YbiS/YcfS/YnhG family)
LKNVPVARTVAEVAADGTWRGATGVLRCALGRAGVLPADVKREGDGATPAGVWPLRRLLWRADRLARPATALSARPIGPDDGWCDDPADPAYNRPVRLPYPARCETLTRADLVYDVVVVLGHNDDPPRPGSGSAIFLHVARPDFGPTDGCIAIPLKALLNWLAQVSTGDRVSVAN